jgi:predicted MFS family arabinose efflux permease
MTKSASADLQQPQSSAEERDASPLFVGLIALCAGITVSNLYLTQPLLPLVAESLRVSPSQVGFLPTIGQVGYALVHLQDRFRSTG